MNQEQKKKKKDYHFKPLSGDESRTEELYFAD